MLQLSPSKSHFALLLHYTLLYIIHYKGGPTHFDLSVRNDLDNFPQPWIGYDGSMDWLPCSPYLASMNFLFWGAMLLSRFLRRRVEEELKEFISKVFIDIELVIVCYCF